MAETKNTEKQNIEIQKEEEKEKMAMDCVNYFDFIYHCCCGDCSGEKTVR